MALRGCLSGCSSKSTQSHTHFFHDSSVSPRQMYDVTGLGCKWFQEILGPALGLSCRTSLYLLTWSPWKSQPLANGCYAVPSGLKGSATTVAVGPGPRRSARGRGGGQAVLLQTSNRVSREEDKVQFLAGTNLVLNDELLPVGFTRISCGR